MNTTGFSTEKSHDLYRYFTMQYWESSPEFADKNSKTGHKLVMISGGLKAQVLINK